MWKKGKDDMIQGTNDCSILSKCSMVAAGYIDDPYIKHFVEKPDTRRSSLINRCYHVRVKAVRSVFYKWLQALKHVKGKQIVSLGAGFDTTYFHLRENFVLGSYNNKDHVDSFKYVEIDYPEVVKRKLALAKMKGLFFKSSSSSFNSITNTYSEDDGVYTAIGFDLRNVGVKLRTLLKENGVDFEKPTLFLSEVSVIYMPVSDANAVMEWITDTFTHAFVCQLEQIEPYDEFGLVMMEHFEKLACPISAVYAHPSIREQMKRYQMLEHTATHGCSLWDVYQFEYSWEEKKRVARLEQFDEFEGWHRTCQHYSVVCTTNSSDLENQQVCKQLVPATVDVDDEESFTNHDESVKLEYSNDSFQFVTEDNSSHPISIQCFGHASVASPFSHSEYIVVGGFGEEVCLNVSKKSDKKNKRRPHLRMARTLHLSPRNTRLLSVNTKLDHPMHATVLNVKDNHLMAFGGRDSPGKCTGEVRRLDLSKPWSEWHLLAAGGEDKPSARWRHTAVVIEGSKMVVVGGRDLHQVFNDVICFDVETCQWSRVLTDERFPPLHSHSCCVFSGSKLAVSGGLGEEWNESNDSQFTLHVIDLKEKSFYRFGFPQLPPRYAHTSHVIAEEYLLVVGGVKINDGNGKPGSDAVVISLKSMRVLKKIDFQAGPPHNHLLGHTSHVEKVEREADSSFVVDLLVIGGGSNCFSFGTSLATTPLRCRISFSPLGGDHQQPSN